MKQAYVYKTDIGDIGIGGENGAITHVFLKGIIPEEGFEIIETPIIKEASAQLFDYLNKKRKEFNLPLMPMGTDFQKKVWQALLTIPYGEVRSYQEIAIQVGCPKGCRAVGLANAKNPIAIFIPCHRVIGKNGTLTGFGGGLPMKEKLISLERN